MSPTLKNLLLRALSSFFLFCPAQADDQKIFDPNQFTNNTSNFQRCRDSTGKLEVLPHDSPYQVGSAVLISSNGYVLTNLHCLQACKALQATQEVKEGSGYTIVKSKSQNPERINCPDAHFEGRNGLQLHGAKVVLIGKGRALFEDSEIQNLSPEVVQQLRDAEGDFAILKFDVGSRKVPCVPLAKTTPTPGESIWSIQYPLKSEITTQLQKLDLSTTDFVCSTNQYFPIDFSKSAYTGMFVNLDKIGDSMLASEKFDIGIKGGHISQTEILSYGVVTKDMSENQYYLQKKFSKSQIAALNQIYVKEGQFSSTLDVETGSSGSGCINKRGELVGLNFSQAVDNSAEGYFPGSTVSISTMFIRSQTQALLGNAKTEEIFSCK